MERWKPDLILYLDQSTPVSHSTRKQIACLHDLMDRKETAFLEACSYAAMEHRERIERSIADHCDGILVDSEMGKKHVMECYGVDADKIFPLYYSIYDALLETTPIKPKNMNEELAGSFLFYPAQFWLHKNHFNLLEALHILRKENMHIPCVLTGDTNQNGYPYFYYLLHKRKLTDSFVLLGYVSEGEMAWLYKNARALVMPTFFGPTNIPPVEALHFGCPVAVSNNYGMPEQLEDAALYFAPDEPETIAAAIKKLWIDEETRVSLLRNSKKILYKTSQQAFTARLHEIIDTMLA